MTLWWLSFCDPDKPAGSQFLGACIVEADHFSDAIATAWRRKCNPGGEVAAFECPKDKTVDPKWMNRLLSRDDIAAMDAEASP